MKLKIVGIEDAGNLDKERVIIKALLDDQVGEYAVFRTKKIGGRRVSSETSATFWFTDHEVKRGDLIIVYTKNNDDSYVATENEKGTTSHSFYWNKNGSLWNNPDDAIVLLHIDEWSPKFMPKQNEES